MEIVREIEAARGDCDAEALRRSDESCVRMMEQYAGMGTELVHTYLGGLRALDQALERMPAPVFDTVGFGRAVTPELLPGTDPTAPTTGLRPLPPLPPAAARAGNRPLAWAPSGTQRITLSSRDDRFEDGRRDGIARAADRAERSRAPFGFGWNRWGVGPVDPYAYGRSSGYSGYRRTYPGYVPPVSGAPGYGSAYGYDSRGVYGDGYGYAYGSGYGYGRDYGYDPRYDGPTPGWTDRRSYGSGPLGWGPIRPGVGYYPGTPRYGYGFRYDAPIDPAFYGLGGYGSPYPGYDPYLYGGYYGQDWREERYYGDLHRPDRYDDRYGRSAYDGRVDEWSARRGIGVAGDPYRDERYDPYLGGYDDRYGPPGDPGRTPAEDWGYDGYDDAAGEGSAPPRAEIAAPRHAPGILLPPEERLRRPWLRD